MKSLWHEEEATQFIQVVQDQRGIDLNLRVYTSRLLGRDAGLVLHGGGNTSVKIQEKDIFGTEEEILYIKGSGWDLLSIEASGFAPVRMKHLLKLATLPVLSDAQMVKEMKMHLINPDAPAPSVETIMHAVLPYKYVDHTHADAVLAVMNTAKGLENIQALYADEVVIIPYVMPGFDLARLVAELFPQGRTTKTIGLMLMHHGVFSFGATAQEAYERMIYLVDKAERFLQRKQAWDFSAAINTVSAKSSTTLHFDLADFRHQLSVLLGRPIILSRRAKPMAQHFARHPDIKYLTQQGPVTPDHVIRTKRLPLLGRDLKSYCQQYKAYFAEYAPQAKQPVTMLDPVPRVVLDPEWGLLTIGKTALEADIVGDIYEHSIETILRAAALGGYQALPAKDIFDVEYWELEQAKLRKPGKAPLFTGEVVLVTGAASGIGAACVEAFLKRGAAVIGLDSNPAITHLHQRPDFLGLVCDLTDEAALLTALEQGAYRFGGIDMLVLNAGIFPQSKKIAELSKTDWRQVMNINMDANLILLKECYPFLKLAPKKGRVVIIGSKNVPAPGPGAAAYSASKAAVNQLMRVAALEWGVDQIRINTIHPNAVFDTGIWTPAVLASRAASYGLTVEEYKKNNVLRTEVTSHDVAELATEMCGPLFAKTTGEQLSVDGGNERVI